jgi:hypothetical protein
MTEQLDDSLSRACRLASLRAKHPAPLLFSAYWRLISLILLEPATPRLAASPYCQKILLPGVELTDPRSQLAKYSRACLLVASLSPGLASARLAARLDAMDITVFHFVSFGRSKHAMTPLFAVFIHLDAYIVPRHKRSQLFIKDACKYEW